MRGSTVLVVLVILGLSLGACSKAVEETVEEAIERQEGVSDVEIDEEGGTLEFSIEDEEGEARVSVGAGELPDGFPFPAVDGAEVAVSMHEDGDYYAQLTFTGGDVDSVVAFYEDFLEREGFETERVDVTAGTMSSVELGGERAHAAVAIVIIRQDDTGTVSISWEAS